MLRPFVPTSRTLWKPKSTSSTRLLEDIATLCDCKVAAPVIGDDGDVIETSVVCQSLTFFFFNPKSKHGGGQGLVAEENLV